LARRLEKKKGVQGGLRQAGGLEDQPVCWPVILGEKSAGEKIFY